MYAKKPATRSVAIKSAKEMKPCCNKTTINSPPTKGRAVRSYQGAKFLSVVTCGHAPVTQRGTCTATQKGRARHKTRYRDYELGNFREASVPGYWLPKRHRRGVTGSVQNRLTGMHALEARAWPGNSFGGSEAAFLPLFLMQQPICEARRFARDGGRADRRWHGRVAPRPAGN